MKTTTKLITAILAVAMLLSLAACGNKAPASDPEVPDDAGEATDPAEPSAYGEFETVVDGVLTMATNAQFPPYEFYKNNKITGIDAEIADAIAEKLGLELKIEDMEFDTTITSVQMGKADLAMAGMTVKPDRLEKVDFTDSYTTGVQVVIVKEDSAIKSVDDLFAEGVNYIIGVQRGTTGDNYTSEDIEDKGLGKIDRYSKGADAVMALSTGKVDCVVIDNEPAKAFVTEIEGLKILDTEYANEDYAIGMNKDNKALYEAVNTVLKELIDDGTVAEIIEKYISAE